MIVPARNEEHNLPRLLASLQAGGTRPEEILVVDDHSTDRTARLAAAGGATVLSALPLPEGWTGKTWACHQGAQAATRPTLLFLDADTWFEPGGFGRLWTEFEAGDGVLSVVPFHRVERAYERLSAFFNLAMAAGINAFGPRGDAARNKGLFGQCLMIRREDYERAGGHAAVQGRILENFWLAGRFQALGIGLRLRGGKGALSFRMFPGGIGELTQGWIKAFASGASRTPALTLTLIVAWMSGGVTAAASLAQVPWGATPTLLTALLLYGAFALQVGWFLSRLGRFGPLVAALYPLALCFYFGVFAASAWKAATGGTVTWKGRSLAAGGADEERRQ